MGFNRRANFVPRYLLFLLCFSLILFYFFGGGGGVEFHDFFFFDLSAVQTEFILDYWNKSDDFWDSLRSFQSS